MEKEIERDLDEGIDSWSANKITLNQAFDEYMNRNKKLRISTKSRDIYIYSVHVRNEIGNLTFDKLNLDVMITYFKNLYFKKNLSPATIDKIYGMLKPLFDNMVLKNNTIKQCKFSYC